MELIKGVYVKNLKVIPDNRGRLMEILRTDEDIFAGLGQIYLSTILPNIVKAWYLHKFKIDQIVCIAGMIHLGLYDDRHESTTFGVINEFYMGIHHPILLSIPPLVYHGWKCISLEEALVINIVTRPYSYELPDEHQLDPYENHIPFNWMSKNG